MFAANRKKPRNFAVARLSLWVPPYFDTLRKFATTSSTAIRNIVKDAKLESQTPDKDLLVRVGLQNWLCPVMALVVRRPWFPETWAFCSWERSWCSTLRYAEPEERHHFTVSGEMQNSGKFLVRIFGVIFPPNHTAYNWLKMTKKKTWLTLTSIWWKLANFFTNRKESSLKTYQQWSWRVRMEGGAKQQLR